MMDFIQKMMDFMLKMMDFILKMVDYPEDGLGEGVQRVDLRRVCHSL